MLTTAERWDPVSKQPLFTGGAVKVTKVQKRDGEVLVHEQQTSYIKKVEEHAKTRHCGGDVHEKPPNLDRFLEYWLAVVFDSFKCTQEICDNLIPQTASADWEVSNGMQVMH